MIAHSRLRWPRSLAAHCRARREIERPSGPTRLDPTRALPAPTQPPLQQTRPSPPRSTASLRPSLHPSPARARTRPATRRPTAGEKKLQHVNKAWAARRVPMLQLQVSTLFLQVQQQRKRCAAHPAPAPQHLQEAATTPTRRMATSATPPPHPRASLVDPIFLTLPTCRDRPWRRGEGRTAPRCDPWLPL